MTIIEIPVIYGDGIGPEITSAVLSILDAAQRDSSLKLVWIPVAAGLSALAEGD